MLKVHGEPGQVNDYRRTKKFDANRKTIFGASPLGIARWDSIDNASFRVIRDAELPHKYEKVDLTVKICHSCSSLNP